MIMMMIMMRMRRRKGGKGQIRNVLGNTETFGTTHRNVVGTRGSRLVRKNKQSEPATQNMHDLPDWCESNNIGKYA